MILRKWILVYLRNYFFYRHLDNENSIERKKRINHGIEFKKQNGCSFFYTLDKNEFFLGDYSREKNIGINTFGFEKEGINKHTLSRSINGFKNVTQSYLLSAFSNCITIASTTEMIIPSRRTRFLNYMTKLEDISQSYYFIKLRSNTIPELSLHMEFYGTIECNEDKNSKNVLQIKKDRSSVDISRMNSSSDCDFIAHIKFNDMQNMQTSRLFIIGVLVSLTITELIRQLYRIAKNISTIRNKDKKSDIDSKLTEIIPDVNAQESEDLPNFYL